MINVSWCNEGYPSMLLASGKGIVGFLQSAGLFLYNLATTLGGPGLLLVALADSSFISVPEGNDLLIVVLSTGKEWGTMLYYVLMTVIGSTIGCSLLYWVGRRGGKVMGSRPRKGRMESIRLKYQKWGVWAVLVPSILPPPTPFKVFVLSAGIFRLPFQRFLVAVAIGRTVRYLAWGVLAVLYGAAVREFIEHNLKAFGLIVTIVTVLTIVLYIVVKRRMQQEVEEAI